MESALNGISFNILWYKKNISLDDVPNDRRCICSESPGNYWWFHGKTMGKTMSPRVGVRKQKNHGGRETELYLVYLAVTIGKKEIVEVEATNIYEVQRQEQQERKKKDWL